MDVQMQLKNNTTEVADYCKGLDDWMKDMGKKDKSKELRETPSGVSNWNILEYLILIYLTDVLKSRSGQEKRAFATDQKQGGYLKADGGEEREYIREKGCEIGA